MTRREHELREMIVERLQLDDQTAEELTSDAILFGEDNVLDSIDALEIELMIRETWGIIVRPSERNRSTFATLATLAAFIEKNMHRDLDKAV